MTTPISNLTVEQIRVFDLDGIPARFIITPTVVNKIAERYHSAVGTNPAQPATPSLHFNGGESFHKN